MSFDYKSRFASILDRIKVLQEQHAYFYMHKLDSPQDSNIEINGRTFINLSSNNYLGLANDRRVKEAAEKALNKYGLGAGASRFLTGTMTLHEQLERKIAAFKGYEAAVVFSTGYMTNVGVISTLFTGQDTLLLDKRCHASIIDGALLSGAKIATYQHNDLESLVKKTVAMKERKGLKAIITEGVFSMDGDIAPINEIQDFIESTDILLAVDEAHSAGVLGKHGRGVGEHFRLKKQIEIDIGTLSKAFGGLGGYVACSEGLACCLKHSARSFIFSTSLPAPVIAGVIKAIEIIETEPELIAHLWDNIHFFKEGLNKLGYNTGNSNSAIIPIYVGNEAKTHMIVKELFDNGIVANPVAFPAVPKGKSIIRISLMASHSKSDLEKVLDNLSMIKKQMDKK